MNNSINLIFNKNHGNVDIDKTVSMTNIEFDNFLKLIFLSCWVFLFLGNYRRGKRVAGCVHGGLDPEVGIYGAFSEYVVQEASLVFRYPSRMSPEAAATIPLAAITAALGLFL